MIKKRIISLALTLLLGPGVGHIYLRRLKKAAVLIGVNIVLAVILFMQLDRASLPTDPMMLMEFISKNRTLYHDLIMASIWAFSLVDVWKLTKMTKSDNQ